MKNTNKFKAIFTSLIAIALVVGCAGVNEIDETGNGGGPTNLKLELSSQTINCESYLQEQPFVVVTCNSEWKAVSDSILWCIPGPTSAIGNQKLILTILQNPYAKARSTKVTVSSGTISKVITINQPAAPAPVD